MEQVNAEDGSTRRLRRNAGQYAPPQHADCRRFEGSTDDNELGRDCSTQKFLDDVDRISLTAQEACDAVVAASNESHIAGDDALSLCAPEDVRFLWTQCFSGKEAMPYDEFLEIFESACMPALSGVEGAVSSHLTRATIIGVLDGFPPNRKISYIEFKRFCTLCASSSLPFHSFISQVMSQPV